MKQLYRWLKNPATQRPFITFELSIEGNLRKRRTLDHGTTIPSAESRDR
jgi:hypothetical protein